MDLWIVKSEFCSRTGMREFCGRLKQTLEEDGKFAVVGVAGDGVRACELMQSCHPDVLALI